MKLLGGCLIVLLSLGFGGCGSRSPQLDLASFGSYVQTYETKSVQQSHPITVSDLVMSFGPVTSVNEQGYCLIQDNQSPQVVINQSAWNGMDETERQILIMHELGHCVQGRVHQNQTDTTLKPLSIMNMYALPETYYNTYTNSYDHEMFWLTGGP